VAAEGPPESPIRATQEASTSLYFIFGDPRESFISYHGLFTRFPHHEALTWARSTNTRRDTSVCLVLYGLYYFERERGL
jgi:hypothetical protein